MSVGKRVGPLLALPSLVRFQDPAISLHGSLELLKRYTFDLAPNSLRVCGHASEGNSNVARQVQGHWGGGSALLPKKVPLFPSADYSRRNGVVVPQGHPNVVLHGELRRPDGSLLGFLLHENAADLGTSDSKTVFGLLRDFKRDFNGQACNHPISSGLTELWLV